MIGVGPGVCVKLMDDYVRNFVETHKIPGLSIAVMFHGKLILAKGYGFSDLTRRTAASEHTIFGIASLTKGFTATAVGQLADSGKLSFEDKVVAHLPGFCMPGGNGQEVTIRHLLTHTSGMPALDALQKTFLNHSAPDLPETSPPMPAIAPINTYADLLAYIRAYPGSVIAKPGEKYNYSNESYALLGAIIRRVSGSPYAAYVRENILLPLGMRRTTFSFEEMYEHDDVTTLYEFLPDGTLRESSRWPCAPAFQATGRLKSSALDAVKFFAMLLNRGLYQGAQLISESAWRQATTCHHRHGLYEHYGHALVIKPNHKGVTLFRHDGMGKGISAHGGFVPELNLATVVLCNLSKVPVSRVFDAVVNAVLGIPLDEPRNVYEKSPWSAPPIEEATLNFASAEGFTFTLTFQENHLYIKTASGNREVHRVTPDVGVYYSEGYGHEVEFHRDAAGKVIAMSHEGRHIPRIPKICS